MANIGIDLGTTHSLVSVVLSGKARVLLDDNENPLFPSVLQYDGNGDLTALGTDALDQTGKDGYKHFVRSSVLWVVHPVMYEKKLQILVIHSQMMSV